MCGIIHTRRDSLPYIKEELRLGKDLKGKELGQGIVQKKSGRYEARYVDRFGKRISISGNDLKDVKKRYNEALYEDDKQINIRESVTLDEWYKEWMNVYKFDVIRENTKNITTQYTKSIYHLILECSI